VLVLQCALPSATDQVLTALVAVDHGTALICSAMCARRLKLSASYGNWIVFIITHN